MEQNERRWDFGDWNFETKYQHFDQSSVETFFTIMLKIWNICARGIRICLFWARSLVVKDLRLETKGSRFDSGC